jgi:diguanylate cyclase (GGDEF)-like protein
MARQLSLRNFLVLPFLILFLGAAGLIGWVGYRSGQESLEQFERQMAAEIGARITAHLDRFFSTAVVVAQSSAEAMRSGQLDPARPDDLVRQFAGQMRYLPYLTFVSFGRADGQYVGATRTLDTNEVRVMTALKREGMTLDTYAVDDANARGTRIADGAAFDARTRIWYRQAEEKGRLTWYPVYKYRPYESLGIGVSAPVYEPGSRRLLGVATGDVALAQIARYLQAQAIGRSGIAFVAEPDGKLIATSLAGPTFRVEGENVVRLAIGDYPDPRMREAGQWAQQAAAGQRRITVDGERHLLDLRSYRDAFGLHLLIGVLLPERDFSDPFNKNLQLAAWLTLAIAALGSLFGVLLTDWLVRPIVAINRRAERIAAGELVGGDATEAPGPIRELTALNRSFNAMATSLRSTFFGLEARVAERTRALEAVNDELERMAMLDGLTHIANRRRFDAVLQQEWRRCLREHQPMSLLMLDVDDFKAYNDEYGHQAGDRVLISVAKFCTNETQRPSDLAARYGGEEFAVILPNTNAAGALAVAEALAAGIRGAAIPHRRATAAVVVTVSIGVATQQPALQKTAEELVGAADTALYAAKRAGRNRVMVSDEMD